MFARSDFCFPASLSFDSQSITVPDLLTTFQTTKNVTYLSEISDCTISPPLPPRLCLGGMLKLSITLSSYIMWLYTRSCDPLCHTLVRQFTQFLNSFKLFRKSLHYGDQFLKFSSFTQDFTISTSSIMSHYLP